MLLATQNLTKEYAGFRALDSLSLEIPQGEIFGLLGPNGSGKSTTIRLLLGMIRPTAGSASIGGCDCWAQSIEVRRQVAYLPGELRLYDNLSGRQLLEFLGGLRGQDFRGEMASLAKRFDIDLKRPIANLSSGMKRKLALMAVLLPRVPLIILDEPTNTLDPTMRDELLDQLLEARRRGQTVMFSSHVLSEVERICDRVGILARGKLVHAEAMERLRAGRQITLRLTRALTGSLPAGVCLVEEQGEVCRLEAREHLPELLGWLARQEVADVRIEPLGLTRIYQRFHAASVA